MTRLNTSVGHRFLQAESCRAKPPVDDYGKAYVAGNIMHGNTEVTADNWAGGVQVESIGDASTVLASLRASEPYPNAYLDIQQAEEAYEPRCADPAGASASVSTARR